jgi:endonuclease-8
VPEGPEIRLAADRVGNAIGGRELARVFFAFDRLKPWENRLTGCRVARVDTRGKAMIIRIGDAAIYSHNQLYGRWYVSPKGRRPPATGRQLRLALETDSGAAWLYSASAIEVLSPDEEAVFPPLARLGPDPLHEAVNAAHLRSRLRHQAFRGRSLAALYLDQKFLAGIGNYLRSEILWQARVHPGARPRSLPAARVAALARASLELPRRSYSTRGVTRDARSASKLKAGGLPRGRWRFYVFGQAERPCPRCGTDVVRETWTGRRLYLCPACQPDNR